MGHASIFSTEPTARAVSEHRHEVQFYESNAFLSSVVARYLAEGFRNGNSMVVIARPEHRAAFRTELAKQGFDVNAAISRGQFNEYDAEETLNKFIDGEVPNRERFTSVIGQVIDECRSNARICRY
jgi:uroporphyrinogen-III synthase